MEKELSMKKPVFIITQTILTIVLIASVASAGLVTMDIRTGGKILPQEWFSTQKKAENKADKNKGSVVENSAEQSKPEETSVSKPQESSAPAAHSSGIEDSSAQESSRDESSKSEESNREESSKPEESSKSDAGGLELILEEPKNLKSNPKELTKFINDYGYDYDSLGFNRLIVVDVGSKGSAKVYCYQKSSKNYWWNIAGSGKAITDKGYIGEKGADFDISPDSQKSPLGFYALDDAFYIGEKPDSTYPMFEITEDTYWVDDTKSEFYNQKAEGTDDKDWSSAKHMIDDEDTYKYGIVIDFNISSPDSKLANSIFMECGNAVTDGSVAVPENVMKSIIEWLDSDSNAYIFISP